MADLVWQQPKEGVQGKSTTHGKRKPAAWKASTEGHEEEVHVGGSEGTGLLEGQKPVT